MSKIKSNKKPKRSVTNKSNSKTLVNNNLEPSKSTKESTIKFDFSYYRPFSVKNSLFTNFYDSIDNYISMQQHFLELLLHLSQFTFTDIFSKTKHSHLITDTKKSLVKSILKAYELNSINENIIDKEIYQLAQSGSFRIIGYFDLIGGCRYFYPIFADPHHLIFKDIKHNNKDTNNYHYSNDKHCIDERNMNILDFDSIMPENCYNCEHMIEKLEE